MSLTPFFSPRGVAVIGASATPGKLGYGVVRNLLQYGYQGGVYPVNPRAETILGRPCFPDIASVPDPVDLAVIIIPAPAVPAVLQDCAGRGIRAATILSGGFAETGRAGAERQAEISAIARAHDMRFIGPNCVGVLDAHSGLNTTFIEQMPDPGPIAFLSQSGAMGGALIDWARGQHIGLSHFSSLGNAADVTETDMIVALADDPNTTVITAYIEGVRNGADFMSAARRVTRSKPIIALKVGGTEAGARAVASHTASLAGADAAYRAAFAQCGVLQAHTAEDLFGIALGLAYQPPPRGDRVAIITNAGGPAAIAADALARSGLALPEPGETTHDALRSAFGPAPQLFNPIDLLGAASTAEFETAARILLESDQYDAILVVLVPNTANDPEGVADGLARASAGSDKPIYACYMGDVSIRAGRERLHQLRIPAYAFPENAARALGAARDWRRWLDEPVHLPEPVAPLPPAIRQTLDRHLDSGRSALGETELYPLLEMLDFPLPPVALAHSPDEAVSFADQVGYPVVLKIASPDILHKSDVDGVRLNLTTAAEVAAAYADLLTQMQIARPGAQISGVLVQKMAGPGAEVIIGMRRDPTFGPMLMFGGGGVYVEALKDVAFRIAPLSRADARNMIAETVAGRLLAAPRGGPPGDIDAVAELILKVADLALAVPDLAEFELNPVIVHPAGGGVTTVDARAILQTQP
ncbi:MAG TPA: acetate--CoA ligase family protein [Caldilineae bacterium]|nr:acetate--CoA ligase family protein [Caldilineae bacterium]